MRREHQETHWEPFGPSHETQRVPTHSEETRWAADGTKIHWTLPQRDDGRTVSTRNDMFIMAGCIGADGVMSTDYDLLLINE